MLLYVFAFGQNKAAGHQFTVSLHPVLFSLVLKFFSYISHYNWQKLPLLRVRRDVMICPVGSNKILRYMFLAEVCGNIPYFPRHSMPTLFYMFDDKDRFRIGCIRLSAEPTVNKSKNLAIFHCLTMQMFSPPPFKLLPWGLFVVPSGLCSPLNLISSPVQSNPLMAWCCWLISFDQS